MRTTTEISFDLIDNSISALDWVKSPTCTALDKSPRDAIWFRDSELCLYDNMITRHTGSAIKYIHNSTVNRLTFEHVDLLVKNLDSQISILCDPLPPESKVCIYSSTGITSTIIALWCIYRGFKYLPMLTDLSSDRFDFYLSDFSPDIFFADSCVSQVSTANKQRIQEVFPPQNIFLLSESFSSIDSASTIDLTQYQLDAELKSCYGANLFYSSLDPVRESSRTPHVSHFGDEIFSIYTSGTTGKPKCIHHATTQYSVYAHLTSSYYFFFDPSYVSMCCGLGFGWINGQTYALIGPLLQGKCICFLSEQQVYSNPKLLDLELTLLQPSVYYSSVASVRKLIFLAKAISFPGFKVSSVHNIGCAGEMLSPSVSKEFSSLFGLGDFIPVNTYFQSETGGVLCATRDIDFKGSYRESAHGTCGQIPPWIDFRLTGTSTNDHPFVVTDKAKSGVLSVASSWPGLFIRSTKLSDDVSSSYFDEFGHFQLNDYAYINEGPDNSFVLSVQGRSDDVINSMGIRVAPGEIEQIANSVPQVLESCCVALPDVERGNKIVLILSFPLSIEKSDFVSLFVAIQQRVGEQLGKGYEPHLGFTVNELPKTSSGKIIRHIVRNQLYSLQKKNQLLNFQRLSL